MADTPKYRNYASSPESCETPDLFLKARLPCIRSFRPSLTIAKNHVNSASSAALSPLTDLAHNLSGATLDNTPRRRLSLLDGGDTSEEDASPQCAQKTYANIAETTTPTIRRVITHTQPRGLFRLEKENAQVPHVDVDKANVMASHTCEENKRQPLQFLGNWQNSQTSLVEESQDSQDSGIGIDSEDPFKFPEAPARRKPSSMSPGGKDKRSQDGLGADVPTTAPDGEKTSDDGFMDQIMGADFSAETEDAVEIPGILKLLSAPLVSPSGEKESSVASSKPSRPGYRRCLSMADCDTPNSTRQRRMGVAHCPIREDFLLSFKRPDPPRDLDSPIQNKRRKSCLNYSGIGTGHPGGSDSASSLDDTAVVVRPSPSNPRLHRCHSETEATIKRALQKASDNLVGDFSRTYALPLIRGRHSDLKSITPETLSSLMKGHYSSQVTGYTVVDCRYPYEFEGGHVANAVNIWTKELLLATFLDGKAPLRQPEEDNPSSNRHILIFHCEFSAERGPGLSRFLRSQDRASNKDSYPALHWPEIYVLEGGYKKFYSEYPSLCEPQSYKPMLDPMHLEELKECRAKTKSWSGDGKSLGGMTGRPSKYSYKRL